MEWKCPDFQNRYTDADIQALKKLHTRQLIKERNRLYFVSEWCHDYCDKRNVECGVCSDNIRYNKERIKAILSTREHVPNKQESKALRKARIKKGE